MVIVEPVAAVVVPIALLAAMRRHWAFLFLLVSVPFFNVEVVRAVSHGFNPPEIALLILGTHLIAGWVRERRIVLPNAGPIMLLWVFLGVAVLSVVWAVVRPPAVLVHPYGQPFLDRTFDDAAVGLHYVTQIVLRGVFVFAVTAVATHLVRTGTVRTAVRGIVYGAVLTALVGFSYQVAVLADASILLRQLTAAGFGPFLTTPDRLGPLPRMYSLPGEPGFTADYLLYAVALTGALAVLPGERWAFSRRKAAGLTGFLVIALLLSTGTTGYGGLVVLAGIGFAAMVVFPSARPKAPVRALAVVAGAGVVSLALYVAAGSPGSDLVSHQVDKMLFRAGSGSIRRYYILRSLDIFGTRPLLGAGVGSHSAPSYLSTLLAETGLIGAATLIGAQIWAFRQSAAVAYRRESAVRRGGLALTVAGATLLTTNLVAKSIVSLLMPWYWFAVALPIAYVALHAGPVTAGRSETPRSEGTGVRSAVGDSA